MKEKRVTRFNISEFSVKKGIHLERQNSKGDTLSHTGSEVISTTPNTVTFDKICLQFKEEMDREFKTKSESKEGDEQVDLERFAMMGKSDYVTTILEKIESFLVNNKIRQIDIPDCYNDIQNFAVEEQRKYSNLTHALFHEIYGLNSLACWMKYPKSYAMQVIGTKIWIFNEEKGRHIRMKFELRSKEIVNKIIRTLEAQKNNAKVNEQNPTLELITFNNERISILIEPRVIRSTLTFRRVLIPKVTLEDMSIDRQMFPAESIPLFRGLSKTFCNTIFGGPMGTAKTTFLKAMIAEREDHLTGISIEQDSEIAVSRDYPNKKFIEMVIGNTSFDDAVEKALRTDADYGVIQEVRIYEAEGAMLFCEKLQKGFFSTTHIWRAETLPQEWARLICRINKGGNEKDEQKRVAENLDIIVLLEQNEQKRKRVRSVQEIRFNRSNNEISTHQIMRYNDETAKYEYRFDLSKQLLSEMRLTSPSWTESFIQALKSLESKNPIPKHDGVTVFNPAAADPQYRLALAMEESVKAQNYQNQTLETMLEVIQTNMNR
jgi:Flp pilus assembly CpaF family ATPase